MCVGIGVYTDREACSLSRLIWESSVSIAETAWMIFYLYADMVSMARGHISTWYPVRNGTWSTFGRLLRKATPLLLSVRHGAWSSALKTGREYRMMLAKGSVTDMIFSLAKVRIKDAKARDSYDDLWTSFRFGENNKTSPRFVVKGEKSSPTWWHYSYFILVRVLYKDDMAMRF